jgi:hypothetical protein
MEAAFAEIARERADAVIVSGSLPVRSTVDLALKYRELPAEPDILASPRFAARTRADLVVLQQQAERLLKRYENVLRIATTVLDTRGP